MIVRMRTAMTGIEHERSATGRHRAIMDNLDDDLCFLACRWICGLIPDDECDDARARLESAGYELRDGKWTKPHRPDPKPISGEISQRSGS